MLFPTDSGGCSPFSPRFVRLCQYVSLPAVADVDVDDDDNDNDDVNHGILTSCRSGFF